MIIPHKRKVFSLLASAGLAIATLVPTVAFAGNDFVDTELRSDLTSVSQSRDYISYVAATARPSSGNSGDFTTGWLGVYLAPYTGAVYSAQFSQVGTMTDRIGAKWFVYAESGVQCLQGTRAWGNLGCVGAYGDKVSLGNWNKVELVTYGQGYWIARVYDQSGHASDVARISSSSLSIYRAMDVGEEGYSESSDPFLTMAYYHWHPQYMVWGQGFRDWPATSAGGQDFIFTSPNSICTAHYGANTNLSGDARYWYSGNTGQRCYVNPLF